MISDDLQRTGRLRSSVTHADRAMTFGEIVNRGNRNNKLRNMIADLVAKSVSYLKGRRVRCSFYFLKAIRNACARTTMLMR